MLEQALSKGHEAQLTLPASMGLADVPDKGTVHADARLINTMARRSPNGKGWEISFVDFGWSGIQKHSRWDAVTCSRISLLQAWMFDIWLGHLHPAMQAEKH